MQMDHQHSAELSRAIAKGKELSHWVTESITGLEFKFEHRSGFATASLDIALEHHDGIILLIEHHMPGPAKLPSQ